MSAGKSAKKYMRALVTGFMPIVRGKRQHTLPGHLVVSLTSYPPRFPTLALTLRSLLSQDVRPDVLVLWVSHEDRKALPGAVKKLQGLGLVIDECPDTKSFKKIVPSLAAYPGSFIVTADDDVHYPRAWLRRFVEEYSRPNEVLCQRARRTEIVGGQFTPYSNWKVIKQGDTGPNVFPTGVAGVMYPPGSLGPKTLSVSEFMRLCPNADDVWLFWMAACAGFVHRVIEPAGEFMSWPKSQRAALWRTNHAGGENDKCIAAMVAAYGMPHANAKA